MAQDDTIVGALIKVMMNEGRPLTAKEAYLLIVQNQLYSFKADEPVHVVRSQLRKHSAGLDFPSASKKKYFCVHEDGRFSPFQNESEPLLRKNIEVSPATPDRSKAPSLERVVHWSGEETLAELRQVHGRYVQETKHRLLESLKSLSFRDFEIFGRELMKAYGFEDIKVTKVSKDGGIDGYGRLKVGLAWLNVAFQCKKWGKKKVDRPELDKFRGAIQGKFEQGVLFTTAEITEGAIKDSIRSGAVPIVLFDGRRIVEIMLEKEIGIEYEDIRLPKVAVDLLLSE